MIKELNEAISRMIEAKNRYEVKVHQVKSDIEAAEVGSEVTLSSLNPYLLYLNKNDGEVTHAMTVDISNDDCKVIAVNIQKVTLEELTRLEKVVRSVLGL